MTFVKYKVGHTIRLTLLAVKNELEVNNSESDCIKVKLCRNPASAASDMYEYKVALFEND